jgi:hypothetical protein
MAIQKYVAFLERQRSVSNPGSVPGLTATLTAEDAAPGKLLRGKRPFPTPRSRSEPHHQGTHCRDSAQGLLLPPRAAVCLEFLPQKLLLASVRRYAPVLNQR